MKKLLRIGSRESKLAVTQAEIVRDMIVRRFPDMEVQIVTMKTSGDLILNQSLELIGGKGLFVRELDLALREGRTDLSVHSLKDMPVEEDADFPVFAYTEREDPRDVLIYKPGLTGVPGQGTIATSSRRRLIQIEKLYPGCCFTGIRGNVQTRLKKLAEQEIDATVLAAAGIARLKMEAVIGRVFSVEEVLPAAGQGILAVQGSKTTAALLRECLNHPESEAAAFAERQFIRQQGGGCTSPAAAYARVEGQKLWLTGLYYREQDGAWFIGHKNGSIETAADTGTQLAKEMEKTYGFNS